MFIDGQNWLHLTSLLSSELKSLNMSHFELNMKLRNVYKKSSFHLFSSHVDFAVGEPPHLSSSSWLAAPALSVPELPPTWTHGPNFSNLEHQLEVLRLLVSFLFVFKRFADLLCGFACSTLFRSSRNRNAPLQHPHLHATGPVTDHLTCLEIARRNYCRILAKLIQRCQSCEWKNHKLGSIKKKRNINQRSKVELSVCNPWPHWYSRCTLTASPTSAYITYHVLDDFKHFQVIWVALWHSKMCLFPYHRRSFPDRIPSNQALRNKEGINQTCK